MAIRNCRNCIVPTCRFKGYNRPACTQYLEESRIPHNERYCTRCKLPLIPGLGYCPHCFKNCM